MDDRVAQRAGGAGKPAAGGREKRVVIFDAPSVFARAFYASRSDKNVDESTTVEIGLYLTLIALDPHYGKVDVLPERVLWCWDVAPKSDKKRDPKPQGYDEEMALFKDALSTLLGATHSSSPGTEADDQVAFAAYRELDAEEVTVVSSDKDIQQLVSGNVRYFSVYTKSYISRAEIINKWGIHQPSQLALALAIIGDPGDGVPGIKGWGPKKVEKLFAHIPPEAKFDEALDLVVSQIPTGLRQDFYHSLDLVLLGGDVEEVPFPAPLSFEGMTVHNVKCLARRSSNGLFGLKRAYEEESSVGEQRDGSTRRSVERPVHGEVEY